MSEITKEQVELMLDNHSKSIELSNVKAELQKVQQENKDLITKLSSEDEVESPVEEIQEEVKEAIEEDIKEDGELSELGEVLAKVAGLEETIASLDVKLEEISSKFKDVCSSIKTVTPLEAGIGKMTETSEEEPVVDEVHADEVVIENHDDETEAEEAKEEAKEVTDEEIESAITILEEYFDAVGSLPELEGASRVTKIAKKVSDKANTEVSSLRKKILDRKPVKELSSKDSALETLKNRSDKRFVYSSRRTRFEGSEYNAGELAGRLFSKNR